MQHLQGICIDNMCILILINTSALIKFRIVKMNYWLNFNKHLCWHSSCDPLASKASHQASLLALELWPFGIQGISTSVSAWTRVVTLWHPRHLNKRLCWHSSCDPLASKASQQVSLLGLELWPFGIQGISTRISAGTWAVTLWHPRHLNKSLCWYSSCDPLASKASQQASLLGLECDPLASKASPRPVITIQNYNSISCPYLPAWAPGV